MRKTPKVSVITPVYNVAKYLPQCLESLKSQSMDDIEFICINDGSTDNCLEILRRFADSDDRFSIIDKPNSGYGATMNLGLKEARGEYIGIVESDDYIDSDAFELLYGIASINNKPDIVKSNYYRHSEDGGDCFVENFPSELCDTILNTHEEPGVSVINTIPAIWSAIYRKDFLVDNDIRFLETPSASFQDTGFVYKSWVAAESFVLCYAAFLHYRVDNTGSSVKDKQKAFCVCDEFESIEMFLKERELPTDTLMPYLTAKKIDTYDWNMHRIDPSLRGDFLLRYISDLKTARENGYLSKTLYTNALWSRITRLLESPESALIELQLDSMASQAIKISVVVPVYNSMPFLKATLNSIKKQTLREIEVVIVNDGSDDGSWEYIQEFCSKDSRFICFCQEHSGVVAARNLALDHIRGEYVAFCDGDDIVPKTAYEVMYRTAKLRNADMVVGREDEFTLTSKTVYARSDWLSKRKVIDKYDVDFNWNLSLCNKLFRASIIVDNHLRLDDAVITEDGIFLCKILKYTQKIAGSPGCVYRYRRHHFFETHSATQRIDKQAIASFLESMAVVEQLRNECADYDIAQLKDKPLEINRIRSNSYLTAEDVRYRTLSTAIERYYRWMWLLEPNDLEYLTQSLDDLRKEVFQSHWEDICNYNDDLDLKERFPTREDIAKHPLVTIIVAPQDNYETYHRLIDSVFQQRFPSFELFIPEDCREWTSDRVTQLPNVHFLRTPSRNAMINESLSCASGSFVNVLEHQIFHSANTLRDMWKAINQSHADFVCANLVGVSKKNRKRALPSIELMYSDEFSASNTIRSKYLALDSSLNNKLFRLEKLKAIAPFTLGEVEETVRLFNSLSFIKLRGVSMACFETNHFFVGRVPEPLKTEYKIFYRWRKKHPYKTVRQTATPTGKRIKKQILFCSNRGSKLSASMQLVYDALPDTRKIVCCEPIPHSPRYLTQLKKAISESKVIVTDDYIHELASITLSDDQSVIQLWHACGALKKFGLDNPLCNIKIEQAKHRQYDAVMVSDESIRGVYARAFGINKGIVKAYGVPRTDSLVNSATRKSIRNKVYEQLPELKNKQVIMYCPTFREHTDGQAHWNPEIDWKELDFALSENQVFIVKKHPLEISEIGPGNDFNHVLVDVAISSEELLTVTDLLITDCSSIVFDYSLLEKPMLFYFPDHESFSRDYYIDFPTQLDAQMVSSSSELIELIHHALNNPAEYLVPRIGKGMMGACDGNSTDRIAQYVRKKLNG